ncbi:UNVERIFIED_CONTAM: hypothetical protein ITH36_25780 [Salmonella enterica subsp. enterica serovar Weltevreden]
MPKKFLNLFWQVLGDKELRKWHQNKRQEYFEPNKRNVFEMGSEKVLFEAESRKIPKRS